MTHAIAALALTPVLLSSGGIRERVEILERDVSTLKEDSLQMRQDQTKILLELEKLNQRLGVAQEHGMADLDVKLQGVDDDVRVLFENLNDMESRMRRLEERIDMALEAMYRRPAGSIGAVPPGTGPAGESAGPTTPPVEEMADGGTEAGQAPPGGVPEAAGEQGSLTPPGIVAASGTPETDGTQDDPAPVRPGMVVDPEELYQSAYTDFARGNYELAVLGFQDYVRRFPGTDLADNAQYWIGESHYSLGRYRQAVQAFQDVEVLYPSGDKVPDAILKQGYSLIELNQMDDGIRVLQRLITQHPRSNAARIARQRLRSMGLTAP